MEYQFKTRVYNESFLDNNEKISLTLKQSHKLINVLRMRENDDIIIFNNIYGEWSAKIKIKKSLIHAECLKKIRDVKKEHGPSLIFSPLKQARSDWLIEKATECGVENLFPSLMTRTSVRSINIERYKSNAIGAAEQTGRLSIPNIEPLRAYEQQIKICETF